MRAASLGARSLALAQLDRGKLTPQHEQLQVQLLQAIADGRLQPGELLPSERELARRLKINRMTVRRALTALRARGQLQSRLGKGWSVAGKIEQKLARLTGFSADMRSLGLHVESQVLALRRVRAAGSLAKQLGVLGQPFYYLERVRLVNGVAVGLERSHVAASFCPGLERFDLQHDSLYRVLREEYGLTLAWADQEIEAGAPDAREASVLQIDPSTPVLRSTRVVYAPDKQVLEFGRAAYRGDKYKYRMQLGGGSNGAGMV